MVESARLVTLTGAGGCGKTRLGLQVAAELLDGSGDGVWLVELAAVTDEDAVPAAISQALRLTAQPGRPARETLLDALALQDVLIVVDNCEHLIGGCAKTAEAIVRRCPRVHLLATSREPLGIGGETIYRVPSLSLPGPGEAPAPAPGSSDAVALFADRARANGVALSVDEQAGPLVVSVCRRLDGMPLAIELAAARLRSMSLAELAGRLDQRFRLLTGGSRTALERQQTLRATVGWSYSLLTGAEQVLLGRLSVFAGGFGLDAAEAVCGSGDLDVLDVAGLLGSLVDKSLVVAEQAGGTLRYRLLETIRLFAAERLAEAGDDEAAAAADAHCAHFLAVAEAAAAYLTGPEQGRWLARLDADQANLRRAAQHAAEDPDGTAVVLRLGVALDRYWLARCRWREAVGLLVPALQRPEARADPGLFAAALITATVVAKFIDATMARQFAEQAVQVARGLGDDRLLITALAELCSTHFFAGEPDMGLPFGQESVQRARPLGDDVLLAASLLLYLQVIGPAARPGNCSARRSPAPSDPATISLTPGCTTTPAMSPWPPGTSPPPGLTWTPRHTPGSRSDSRTLPCRRTSAWCCARKGTPTAPGPRSGQACGSAAGTVTTRAMAYAILGLACLAGDAGDWDRAAALHGAAQAFFDRTGNPWQKSAPLEARNRRDSLAQVRAHLGDEQLERAYAQGMALSLEKALDLALGKASPA